MGSHPERAYQVVTLNPGVSAAFYVGSAQPCARRKIAVPLASSRTKGMQRAHMTLNSVRCGTTGGYRAPTCCSTPVPTRSPAARLALCGHRTHPFPGADVPPSGRTHAGCMGKE
eukprot:gene11924-biopygen10949